MATDVLDSPQIISLSDQSKMSTGKHSFWILLLANLKFFKCRNFPFSWQISWPIKGWQIYLLNIESKCPCFWYILTLHHLIFLTEFVTFDCQKRLLWSLEKQYLIKLFFKNGVIYGDQEPLSNKNRFFHWIFALPTGWKVSKYGFTQCSALAMSVGNKNVFDGELKLLFVTSSVESL